MCTVTLVKTATGYRFFENRDESRDRLLGATPQVYALKGSGATQGVWPTDVNAGGTWIAANNAGISMSVLNYNLPEEQVPPLPDIPQSRGHIILRLIGCKTVQQAWRELSGIDAQACRPFRLVVTDGIDYFCWHSTEKAMHVIVHQLVKPMMWTSSSLGDAIVQPSRERLFDEWEPRLQSLTQQRSFHAHQWPRNLPHSVCMSRADAKTVSMTEIEVSGQNMRMSYFSDWPEKHAEDTSLVLAHS